MNITWFACFKASKPSKLAYSRTMVKKALLLILTGILFPLLVLAAVDSIQSLSVAVARVVWFVFTVIAVICFIIAGIMFLTAQGEPDKIKLAKSAFLWGLAGVVVGLVAFSMIRITCDALGINPC